MSFYSKGQFKIQDSWEPPKKDNSKESGSRNSQRRSSNNGESLMRQLAESIQQPSTDMIDDSLSKLLMKQRSQNYNAIPKPKRQGVQHPTTKNTQHTHDSDLVSSMANRLQKLEKTCQSQRLQIKQQKQTIDKIKTENAFLKGMKEDSGKTYEEMQAIKKKNEELEKKCFEMEAYLKQYGLKWVGNKVEGKLNDKAIKKEISDSKYPYRLPSEVDIGTLRRRVDELNAGLQAEGMGTEIYNEKGIHKFRKAENLPIGFYANGIVIKGYNFYPYKSKESLKILADLLDGYFPFIFKSKYPNGVFLEVVDHVEQNYVQEKKDDKIGGIGSEKDFQPMSREEFLNKLPQQVIKDGKVIPVRGQIQKLFTGAASQNKKQEEDKSNLVQVEGGQQLKTQCWSDIHEGRIPEDECCILKIRNESGGVFILKMLKTHKTMDIIGQLRKIVRCKFSLMSNFPKRTYTGDEDQNLQELGFFPNQNLHILIAK